MFKICTHPQVTDHPLMQLNCFQFIKKRESLLFLYRYSAVKILHFFQTRDVLLNIYIFPLKSCFIFFYLWQLFHNKCKTKASLYTLFTQRQKKMLAVKQAFSLTNNKIRSCKLVPMKGITHLPLYDVLFRHQSHPLLILLSNQQLHPGNR